MLKTAILYRVAATWEMPSIDAIESALDSIRFAPCGPTQAESFGWVEPRREKHGVLVEKIDGQFIFALKTEIRSVPASAVKDLLDTRIAAIKEQTGRKPGSKEKKELKEEIVIELLPRAFTKSSVTMVWLDPKNKVLVIGAGSISKADKVTTALIEAFNTGADAAGLPLTLIQTNTAPATAMSGWLVTQKAPYAFSVDRECELKAPDESKSVVRYSRHTLEIDEVVEHIRNGKQATQLAMTWNSRVSFVLTDTLTIKKIEFLDVVMEGVTKGKGEEDNFDADVTIATGELQKLIPDLLEALDGEQAMDASAPVAPASQAESVASVASAAPKLIQEAAEV